MGECSSFEMKHIHILVPFKDNQNENCIDLCVHLISNSQIFDIDIIISKCDSTVVFTQVWSNTTEFFMMKVLLKPFKNDRDKRL